MRTSQMCLEDASHARRRGQQPAMLELGLGRRSGAGSAKATISTLFHRIERPTAFSLFSFYRAARGALSTSRFASASRDRELIGGSGTGSGVFSIAGSSSTGDDETGAGPISSEHRPRIVRDALKRPIPTDLEHRSAFRRAFESHPDIHRSAARDRYAKRDVTARARSASIQSLTAGSERHHRFLPPPGGVRTLKHNHAETSPWQQMTATNFPWKNSRLGAPRIGSSALIWSLPGS
jgi:hypothetical protein